MHFAKRAINFLARRAIKRNILMPGIELPAKDFRYLLEVADAIQANVIWLGYGNISYLLLKYIKYHFSSKVVVDTDSVWSRFILRRLPFAKSEEERQRIELEGKEKEKEERWGTQLADVTTAVSQIDAEYYRRLAKHPQQIHIFSNVIDPGSYLKVPPPAYGLKKPCIYLAGTFFGTHSPMEDAARWVIEEILPLVRQRLPDIHFYIVGKGSDQVLSDIADGRITVTGQLPSVLPYLCYADVVLVPLRYESGTRFKILEAGVCGIPVVSTTLGAEGIPVTHEKDILIVDEPKEFARSIIRLVQEREFALKLAENLRILVTDRYGISTLIKEGSCILEYLTDN